MGQTNCRSSSGPVERHPPLARPGSLWKTCTSVGLSAVGLQPQRFLGLDYWNVALSGCEHLPGQGRQMGDCCMGRKGHCRPRNIMFSSDAEDAYVLFVCQCFFLLLSLIHRLSLASSRELLDCKETVLSSSANKDILSL